MSVGIIDYKDYSKRSEFTKSQIQAAFILSQII